MSQEKPAAQSLKIADEMLEDYTKPNSLIDLGNLFFAATEYRNAYRAKHEALMEKPLPESADIEEIRTSLAQQHSLVGNIGLDVEKTKSFLQGFDAAVEKLYRQTKLQLDRAIGLMKEHMPLMANAEKKIDDLTQDNEKFKAALGNLVTEMQVFLDVSHKHHFPDARKAQDEAKEALKGACL